MVGDPDRISVLCVGTSGVAAVARGLRASSDRLDVTARDAPDVAVDALDDAVDCLVAVDEAGLSLFDDPRAPPTRVAYLDPDGGAIAAALDRAETDVVPAVTPDGVAVLSDHVCTAVDRERAVRENRAAQARFEALTNNTNYAVVTIDDRSIVQYASPAVEDLFGYAPDEMVGESLTTIMPERFHQTHREAVTDYLETGERSLDWGWIELPGQRRDGSEIPLGVSFGERTDGDDYLFSAVIRDMSDRNERQERLDRLASAVEASMDGVGILDADGVFRFVNDAHADVYGYDSPDQLEGRHWQTLYDERETERFEEEVMPTFREQGQWRGEVTGKRADGTTFPQEVSLTELDSGEIVCVVRDIADRVEQRRELSEERQFTETVIDTLPDLFYVLNEGGSVRRWNDKLTAVTGYDDELDGMSALEIIAPDDRERVAEAMATVLDEGETESVRADLLTDQGDRIPHAFSGTPVTDADGSVVGLAGIGRDISDERLREQRLSVLSRVLRHNVRNQTNVIRGHARHVRTAVEDPDLRAELETVERAATDLASTSDRARRAEQLLRDDRSDRQQVDLADVVRTAVADVGTDEVSVETDLPERAPAVAAGFVGFAVQELVVNSREHVADPTVRVTVESLDDDTLGIVVSDDGPGIPENERAALASGDESQLEHATGLGLWLVNWIVTTAGGRVVFRNGTPGATVVLSFPVA